MSESAPTPVSLRRTRLAVLAVTLLVFAALIAFATWQLRTGLRDQILRREGETLAAVASLQLATGEAALAEVGLADEPGELVNAVLQASKLRGVLAIRVFDANRQFAGALPWVVSEAPPPAPVWAGLAGGRAVTRLHPRENLAALVGLAAEAAPGDATVPLVESWVPLLRSEGGKFSGAAQFWIDGRALAAEFAALDRRLATQAILAWLAGAAFIALALAWAFRRLAESNRALQERTEDLQRANRELALVAKTSALGTVTAHLIHGLKNPLAGLELFLGGLNHSGAAQGEGGEWQAANDLTRRLRGMVDDVVGVLRDEQAGNQFELSCAEVVEIAVKKAEPLARTAGVALGREVFGDAALPGRRANLALLVLQNLLQNAIEASARGGTVRLAGRAMGDGAVEFSVEDRGPGLPAAVRERLFQPCQSAKAGGSGLGIALSHQLSLQAGGRLELERSDAQGCCFRLIFPADA
jgi:signal transduction histidine kinase